jgi:hypothetical protein
MNPEQYPAVSYRLSSNIDPVLDMLLTFLDDVTVIVIVTFI